MVKKLTISILALLVIIVVPVTRGFSAEKNAQALLRDGFVLVGVDGKLTTPDSNQRPQESLDRWFFEFDSDVTDGRGRVSAGTSLELLPSAALERMTVDTKNHSAVNHRLWARVTKYRGRNFIFPTYFLPLSQTSEPEPPKLPEPQQQESKPIEISSTEEENLGPAINEPNDILAIPQEIIEKLRSRRIVRTEKLKEAPKAANPVRNSKTNKVARKWGISNGAKPAGDDSHPAENRKVEPEREKRPELEQDSILADRIGFISSCVMRDADCAKRNTRYDFVLDAVGRNAPSASGGFGLLPCEVLERTEQKQSAEIEPLRFKVAGIVTKYKGRHYLLLQKATRVYSYENFGR